MIRYIKANVSHYDLSLCQQSISMKVFIQSFALLALIAAAYASNCPKEEGDYAVTIGNPGDCRTFYICDNGIPILQKCPGNLEYNSALGVCDWPADAGCTAEPTTTDGLDESTGAN